MLDGVDVETVALFGGGFGVFLGAAWAGIRQGLKKVKANEADPGMRIAGGVLMNNTSMLMLSERLRENTDAVHHHGDHLRELAHQMERLRDSYDHRGDDWERRCIFEPSCGQGRPTRWGTTQAEARANGYKGDMRDFPRALAVEIYRLKYAIRLGFAAVAEISPPVGEELFDTGVNMGPSVPALWLQMVLNALNNGGQLYDDIKEDGDIGPATLTAFKALRKARGADADVVMLKALNCLQGARYIEISRTRAANEAFTWGWLRTRVDL